MLNGDAVTQAGDDAKKIAKAVAADASIRIGHEGDPHLHTIGSVVRIAKIGRHHTDDIEGGELARQLLADHVAVAAESPLP